MYYKNIKNWINSHWIETAGIIILSIVCLLVFISLYTMNKSASLISKQQQQIDTLKFEVDQMKLQVGELNFIALTHNTKIKSLADEQKWIRENKR